jgi:hypothetical protein
MRPGEHRSVKSDAPEVRAMFAEKDKPMSVALVGSGVILATVLSRSMNLDSLDPQHRAIRLAFGTWDRIRTGEMATWSCFLCEASYAGLDELSCIGIISALLATRKTPAVGLPICHRCDSTSTEHTKRRIAEMFPLGEAGRA